MICSRTFGNAAHSIRRSIRARMTSGSPIGRRTTVSSIIAHTKGGSGGVSSA
jgi:hypothetical protein